MKERVEFLQQLQEKLESQKRIRLPQSQIYAILDLLTAQLSISGDEGLSLDLHNTETEQKIRFEELLKLLISINRIIYQMIFKTYTFNITQIFVISGITFKYYLIGKITSYLVHLI